MVDKFDYQEMLDVANELINEFGQDGIAITPGAQSGDPFNPTIGAPTNTNIVLVETEFKFREIDNEKVLASDKQLIIRADAPALFVTATEVQYGSPATRFKIVSPVQAINPGGLLLLYIAQVRA